MKERLEQEARQEEIGDLWAATLILMGLRYPRPLAEQLLKGVRQMEESVTYQAILERGVEKGKVLGKAEEARALLMRIGRKRLGQPDAPTLSTLQGISDVQRLEALCERVQEVSSWDELLRTGP
jgi:predicted transposase YdaD